MCVWGGGGGGGGGGKGWNGTNLDKSMSPCPGRKGGMTHVHVVDSRLLHIQCVNFVQLQRAVEIFLG